MIRIILLLLVVLSPFTGCRKRGNAQAAAGAGSAADPAAVEIGPTGEPVFAPAPPPKTSAPPEKEAARFNAPQPMNMYAPVYPGDYQSQLDAYNRVLRKWLEDSSAAPRHIQDIMGTFNSPKPPQPPAGRRLVYDPKTKLVTLQ